METNFCEAQARMLLQVRNILSANFLPKNVIILLFSGSKCTSVNTSSSCPDWVRVDGTDNNIFDGIYCKTSQLVHGSPVYKGPCSKNVCMALSRWVTKEERVSQSPNIIFLIWCVQPLDPRHLRIAKMIKWSTNFRGGKETNFRINLLKISVPSMIQIRVSWHKSKWPKWPYIYRVFANIL